MTETFQLGELSITLTRKEIKNVHLTVHPPDGRVTLTVPETTRLDVARAYAISKLEWIREQQLRLRRQSREALRRYVERESHYLWGRRYLLNLRYHEGKPQVILDHRRITLLVKTGSDEATRAAVLHKWHKTLLHQNIPPLLQKWEAQLGVKVNGYFLQRMKTKWGSCHRQRRNIRLNTELIKKPRDLLEYVIVHELAHLLEPSHNERFKNILDRYFPLWREARAELNELPLRHEEWRK